MPRVCALSILEVAPPEVRSGRGTGRWGMTLIRSAGRAGAGAKLDPLPQIRATGLRVAANMVA